LSAVADTFGVTNVTVNSGGTVTVTAPARLYICKSSGMTVNGTLIIAGNVPTASPYTVMVPGVLTIGATGWVYYQQGAPLSGTKPSLPNATWLAGSTLQVDSTGGSAAASFGAGGGQNFSNIIWNATKQAANFAMSLYSNTISGSVTVLSTGTFQLRFFGSNPGTCNIMGDLIVKGSSNVTTNGTTSATIDTLFINGKVNVSTTGIFAVSRGTQGNAGTSTMVFRGDSVKIIAATIQNSDTGSAVGKFVFKKNTGDGKQYVNITPTALSGNGTPIEVDSGATVYLTSKLNVTTLYLYGGIIKSTASNPLVMGWWTGTTLTNGNISPTAPGSTTSYVDGPMSYLYATALGTTSKTYPIGKSGTSRPLTLSLQQTAATLSTYTAEMFNSAPPANSLPGTLNNVSTQRYYIVTEGAGGSTFSNGSIKLSYGADDGVIDTTTLRVAEGRGAGGTWINLLGSGKGSLTNGTITSATPFTDLSLSTDSIFTLGNLGCKLTLTAFFEGLVKPSNLGMRNDLTPINVTAELHNATAPYGVFASQTGVLDTLGVGIFAFPTAVKGTQYYIVINSPNTVQGWSASPQVFTSYVLSYDFTSGLGQAYTNGSGNPMVQKGAKWCFYSGDVTQDHQVTFSDLLQEDNDNNNYVTGATVTDLTGDQQVTFSDLIIVDNNNSNYIARQWPGTGTTAVKVQRPVKIHVQQ
jgi:hypothetical protein